jgi:hypothetical protein
MEAPWILVALTSLLTMQMKTEGMQHLRCMNVSEADWIAKEVYTERVYTPEGIRTWPGMRVVDVGGSIGLFAIFAKKCLRASSVMVIEPAMGSWSLCQENLVASFGETHGVQIHR